MPDDVCFRECPKFHQDLPLSSEDVECIILRVLETQERQIANKAQTLIKEQFYKEVGKSVVAKFFYGLGLVVVALAYWLHDLGWLRAP